MALLKFKRSAVSGKVPALADLELGELAINTFDGKLYLRKDNGTASIVEVGAGAGSGVLSFNTRTGNVTLTSGDVTGALGYTPYNSSNPAGYITGITSSNVTTALGYTPANKAGDTFTGSVNMNGNNLTNAYYLWATGDARAPIFYDSNNTGYYVDPASTSVINGLNVGSNTPLFSNGGFQYHQYQSAHIAYVKKTGGYNWYWRRNDTGLSGGANEVENMSLTDGGTLAVNGDMRAPIFYDSNDTNWYVEPNAYSKLLRLGVAGETEYPGSINNDYDGGYYHFGPSDNTPTGGYGHAHIIRLNADWNVQMFFPTSNTNEPMWLRRKQNGTYSAWRRLLQEDEWIGSKYFASDGRIYGTILYDSNNTAYYVDPNANSVLYSFDNINQRCSYSRQWDNYPGISVYNTTDQGPQGDFRIFGSAGANGGDFSVRLLVDGNIQTLADLVGNAVYGTIFYDNNNTSCYVDPSGTSWFKGNIYSWRPGPSNDCFGGIEIREADGVANANTSASYAPGINFHWSMIAAARIYMASNGAFVLGGQSDITNNRRSLFCSEIYATGNVIAYYSDERLKTRLGNITGALDIVRSLTGFRYVANELAGTFGYDTKKVQVGISAQDASRVLPEVVGDAAFDIDIDSPDGGSKTGEFYKTVDYARLVPVLIEAIKELEAQVDSLKAERK